MKLPLILLSATLACAATAAPVKLIFDTDMGNDVDDIMALDAIHTLQDRGACELLAVTITKSHPDAAEFVDVINTFHGYPDIPVGLVKDGVTPDQGKYIGLSHAKTADGKPMFPHDLRGSEAPEAVGLLRKVLAGQADGSVVIVQVGFSTNLARLLDTEGDEHSPLSGMDLIKQKVSKLVLMAGTFQTVYWNTRHLEYNVVKDIPAAKHLAAKWPTPMIWSGFEIGLAAPFPCSSIDTDLDWTDHHPLAEAYRLYARPDENRPTWDATAVLYAVYPDRGYFDLSPPGTVKVQDDGGTSFTGGKGGIGQSRLLKMSPEQASRVAEAVLQLAVAIPAKHP